LSRGGSVESASEEWLGVMAASLRPLRLDTSRPVCRSLISRLDTPNRSCN